MTHDPAVRVRRVFRDLSLALMEWQDPPLMSPREYRRLELLGPCKWTPPAGDDIEPFDVQADWEELA